MKTNSERAVLRLIRFLEKGDAVVRRAAAEGRVLVEAGERGVIGLAGDDLQAAQRAGLVEDAHGRLALTCVGRMALRRKSASSGDAHNAQHREEGTAIVLTETGLETVTVNHAESPLAMLRRRTSRSGAPFIDAREFNAGERLRADYARGQLMPRTGVNWSAAGGAGRKSGDANGVTELTDAALAARLRVEKAIQAVGPELAGVLIDICCFLKGLERVEIERNWPARSAKVVLRSALAALARHYEPQRREGARAILHWGADDFRPRTGG